MAWGLGLCARGETDETDERAARRERDASRNHAPYMTHPASPVNVIMMSLGTVAIASYAPCACRCSSRSIIASKS